MSSHSGDAAREPGPAGAMPAREAPDFRLLFEALPGAFCVLDPDLVIIAASDAYLRDTRTSRAGIVGLPIAEVFPGRPDPRGLATLRASLDIVRSDRVADTIVVDRYDIPAAGPGGEPDARYWTLVNVPVPGPEAGSPTSSTGWTTSPTTSGPSLIRPAVSSRPAPSRAASSGSRRTCWPCRRACSRATGPCRKPTRRCMALTTPRRTSSTGSATSSAPRCTPSSASASCSAWMGSVRSTGSGSP